MKNGWFEDEYGLKIHYVNDVVHNGVGPAIIYPDETQEYYLFNIQITKQQHDMWLGDNPFESFTKEQVMLMIMLQMLRMGEKR